MKIKDNAGWTPIHEAANHGFLDIVELLLEHGADINSKGGGGYTPLASAADGGNFVVMEYLLDRNASVSVLTDEVNGCEACDLRCILLAQFCTCVLNCTGTYYS